MTEHEASTNGENLVEIAQGMEWWVGLARRTVFCGRDDPRRGRGNFWEMCPTSL